MPPLDLHLAVGTFIPLPPSEQITYTTPLASQTAGSFDFEISPDNIVALQVLEEANYRIQRLRRLVWIDVAIIAALVVGFQVLYLVVARRLKRRVRRILGVMRSNGDEEVEVGIEGAEGKGWRDEKIGVRAALLGGQRRIKPEEEERRKLVNRRSAIVKNWLEGRNEK